MGFMDKIKNIMNAPEDDSYEETEEITAKESTGYSYLDEFTPFLLLLPTRKTKLSTFMLRLNCRWYW